MLEMSPPHLQVKSKGDGDFQQLEIKKSEVGQEKKTQKSHATNPKGWHPRRSHCQEPNASSSLPLGYGNMDPLETQVFLSTHQYSILRADNVLN